MFGHELNLLSEISLHMIIVSRCKGDGDLSTNNGHNMMIILTLSYSFMAYFVEYYKI